MAKTEAIFEPSQSLGTIGSSISQQDLDSVQPRTEDQGLARALNDSELEVASQRQALTDYANYQSRMPNDSMDPNDPEGPYYEKLGKYESNNKYDASNKSGAYGKYQFMPDTEKEVAGKLGMTIAQARTPDGQEQMIRQFTQDNIEGLQRNGIPVNDETLWWAHNQGLQGAINLHKGIPLKKKNLTNNGAPSGTNAEYIARWRPTFGSSQAKHPGLAGSGA